MQPSNSDRQTQPWWRARLASFGFAIAGIKELVSTQPHARFHLIATILVVAAGLVLGLSITSWSLIVLAIGSVWTAEAFNTAVEYLVDLVHPQWHENAGRIKDLSAGAVLLISVAAAIIGLLVFGSRLVELKIIPYLG